jgi:hypothetical protein
MSNIEKKIGSIALLDILGFKGLWNREGPEQLINSVIEIQEYCKKWIKAFNMDSRWTDRGIKYTVQFFSDTLIITVEEKKTTKDDSISNFYEGCSIEEIAYITGVIFNGALSLNMLLRGAISYGEYYKDDNNRIIMGLAVDEVGDWYNKAEWAGIHLTPSAYFKLKAINADNNKGKIDNNSTRIYKTINNHIFIMYSVPINEIKANIFKIDTYAINWVSIAEGFGMGKSKKDLYLNAKKIERDVLNRFSKQPLGIIGVNVERKYKNTLKFVETVLDKLK